jgi:hypothetical protein
MDPRRQFDGVLIEEGELDTRHRDANQAPRIVAVEYNLLFDRHGARRGAVSAFFAADGSLYVALSIV